MSMKIVHYESLTEDQKNQCYFLWDCFLNKLSNMDFYEAILVDDIVVGLSAIDNPAISQTLSIHYVVCRNHRRKGFATILADRAMEELEELSAIYQKEIEIDVVSVGGLAVAKKYNVKIKDRSYLGKC